MGEKRLLSTHLVSKTRRRSQSLTVRYAPLAAKSAEQWPSTLLAHPFGLRNYETVRGSELLVEYGRYREYCVTLWVSNGKCQGGTVT